MRSSSAAAESLGCRRGHLLEVGRLYNLLGRRDDWSCACSTKHRADESRDRDYIDAIAFLVQRGDAEPALDIYRRAIVQVDRVVSEYVRCTPRCGSWTSPGAAPPRPTPPPWPTCAPWMPDKSSCVRARFGLVSTGLVRYALRPASATTDCCQCGHAGKRAEVSSDQAMRLLAEGKSTDAHALWSKSSTPRMASFLRIRRWPRAICAWVRATQAGRRGKRGNHIVLVDRRPRGPRERSIRVVCHGHDHGRVYDHDLLRNFCGYRVLWPHESLARTVYS